MNALTRTSLALLTLASISLSAAAQSPQETATLAETRPDLDPKGYVLGDEPLKPAAKRPKPTVAASTAAAAAIAASNAASDAAKAATAVIPSAK